MKYTLKKPCKSCPFVKDNVFSKTKSLDVNRITQIINDTVLGDRTFQCHNTLDTDPIQCAGALIMENKVNPYGNKMHKVANRLKIYEPEKLKEVNSVYGSVKEMKKAYE